MKITIQTQKLRDGISKISNIVERKSSRPILTNCLVELKNSNIELIATDLEVTAKIILEAKVEGTGKFCLNTKNIVDILRELPEGNLELIIDENKNLLNVKCEKIDYSLLITSPDEFPLVNFETNKTDLEIKNSEVLNFINKTYHAISTDETRLNLNGIYLQELDSKIRVVAIDGHRLALVDLKEFVGSSSVVKDGIIIPKKGVNEIKRLAESNPDKPVSISIDEAFIYFSTNKEYFLSIRLIAREYPKYQTVIPSKTAFVFKVDKTSLLNAVKRIRILSNEKTNGIKFSLKTNELVLSANHPSYGNASEVLPIDYNGADIEIGFNAKYMIDSLSVLSDSEVIFEFNNELSPIIVRTQDLPDFLGIIMPLKL